MNAKRILCNIKGTTLTRLVPLLIASYLSASEEVTYDAQVALWANKYDQRSSQYVGKNNIVSAKQEPLPGIMQRVRYVSNALGLRPLASLSSSTEGETIFGALGIAYHFENDIVVSFETEAGKFRVDTTLDYADLSEHEFEDTFKYAGARLKIGSEGIGGFLSYKRISSPNVDLLVDGYHEYVVDLYYDPDFTSTVACVGVYGAVGGQTGFRLEADIGAGVSQGKPGDAVQELVKTHYGISPDTYTSFALDMRLDINYRQRFYSNGLWFVGFRTTLFGDFDAITNLDTIRDFTKSGTQSYGGDVMDPKLTASRADFVYGPYFGVGLVF